MCWKDNNTKKNFLQICRVFSRHGPTIILPCHKDQKEYATPETWVRTIVYVVQDEVAQVIDHVASFLADRSYPFWRKRKTVLVHEHHCQKWRFERVRRPRLTVPVSLKKAAYEYLMRALAYIQSTTFPAALRRTFSQPGNQYKMI
jgi:hypothetical protein